jgi:hypothetical protein
VGTAKTDPKQGDGGGGTGRDSTLVTGGGASQREAHSWWLRECQKKREGCEVKISTDLNDGDAVLGRVPRRRREHLHVLPRAAPTASTGMPAAKNTLAAKSMGTE